MTLDRRVIEVRNPRTGLNDYRFSQPSAAEASAHVAGLREAQAAWLALGVDGRCDRLRAFSAALGRHDAALYEALCADTGRYAESRLEIDALRDAIARWCGDASDLLEFGNARKTAVPFISAERTATPYALAGIIAPWNFPLLLSFVDSIPALLAGCAIALKPSEITPRFVEPLRSAVDEVDELRDVLGVFAGDGSLGAWLVGQVDVLCFTGSVRTGRQVARAAAESFIPAHLELGGKDPAIVLDDADIERAAAAISWGGLANAGQSCLSIERIYVDSAVHDEFVAALAGATRTLRLNALDEDGQIGPVIAASQIEIIRRHLDDAREKGARVECGGNLEVHGGTWCQPTVLSRVDHDMLVMTDESFAPILPVMAFDDVDEAVRLANDTRYGLSAAVFGAVRERVRGVASRLQAGAISLNDAALTAFIHDGEKQAFKASGLGGSRMGHASLARFYRAQVLLSNDEAVWDPWWHVRPDSPANQKGKRP